MAQLGSPQHSVQAAGTLTPPVQASPSMASQPPQPPACAESASSAYGLGGLAPLGGASNTTRHPMMTQLLAAQLGMAQPPTPAPAAAIAPPAAAVVDGGASLAAMALELQQQQLALAQHLALAQQQQQAVATQNQQDWCSPHLALRHRRMLSHCHRLGSGQVCQRPLRLGLSYTAALSLVSLHKGSVAGAVSWDANWLPQSPLYAQR